MLHSMISPSTISLFTSATFSIHGPAAGWGGGAAATSLPAAPARFLADASGFNLWATFNHAELAGKIIVVLLLFFSLLAWTVMIGKYLDLSRLRQMNLSFQRRLSEERTLLVESVPGSVRQQGPYARLYHDAITSAGDNRAEGETKIRLSLIENALQRGVAEECIKYESKMIVLGSLVSGAPFIGLLGTVWGVMVAFSAMSTPDTATLQNLAPGVASALLATVSGLLVAIPSVFGYNFLLTQVKVMITEIENYASWLADRLELELGAAKAAAVAAAAPVQPMATAALPPKPAAAPANPAIAAAERYLRCDVSEENE
jgi:biopolymer transport protein TolQ